jgi:hypothetical protein
VLEQVCPGVRAAADEEVGAERDGAGGAEVEGAYGNQLVGRAGLLQQNHERNDGGVVLGRLGTRHQQPPVHDLIPTPVARYVDNPSAHHPISLTDFVVPPPNLSTTQGLTSDLGHGPTTKSAVQWLARAQGRGYYVGRMLIAEDLLLLLYDDESGKPITGSPGLDYALAGAVLIELTMLGKLDIADEGESVKRGRLKVLDAGPAGDAILDERLAVVAAKPGKRPKDQMGKLSKKLRDQVLARLAERGLLEAEHGKVLGLFPVARWPAKDARHEAEVRTALESVLKLGTTPDERTGALIALLSALNVVPKVVTDAVDKKALKQRAKEIADSDWAADAVKKAVAEMQAAIIVTLAATTAAGASGS